MKTIATIVSLLGGFFVGIVSAIYGWGLQPHNWGWIIGAAVVQLFIVLAVNVLATAAE